MRAKLLSNAPKRSTVRGRLALCASQVVTTKSVTVSEAVPITATVNETDVVSPAPPRLLARARAHNARTGKSADHQRRPKDGARHVHAPSHRQAQRYAF